MKFIKIWLFGYLVPSLHRVEGSLDTLQAENGSLSDARLKTRHIGYQGSGYVDYNDRGGGEITWNYDAASSGNAEISIRYATKAKRPLDLYVDGSKMITFSCSGTGGWANWDTETVVVRLDQGTRSLGLKPSGLGPNVDSLSIRSDGLSGPSPTPIPATVPTDSPQRDIEDVLYEAEAALSTRAVSIQNVHSGFSGSGYADYQGVGAYLLWSIEAPSTAEYEIRARYASANERNCYLYVDGVRKGTLRFQETGAWSSWRTEAMTVQLGRGSHNLKISAETSPGPNIDWVIVRNCGSSCSAAPVPTPRPTPRPNPTPTQPTGSIPGTNFAANVVVASNSRIDRGEFVSSPNGQYKVGLTNQGDLVLLQEGSGRTIWSAGTAPNGFRCFVQSDGNVIVRQSNNRAIWTSKTYDHAGAELVVDDGGRIAVTEGNIAIWLDGVPRGTYTGRPSNNLIFPVRGMFYYPWYPETWTVNGQPIHYEPDIGLYSNSDPAVIQNHIDAFDYAWVDLVIASWWGPETNQDRGRLTMLMDEIVASESGVKVSVYHEDERNERPSPSQLKEDLDYLKKWFAWHPVWAHVDDRPVIFAFNGGGCDVARRWMEASDGEWYVVLKLFPGFKDCPIQPDHWHQYGVGSGDPLEYQDYSFTIAPGFWLADRSTPRLPRLGRSKFCSNVEQMVQSEQPWQLIVSFNEHGEATGVESSKSWSSETGYGYYLDCLHEFY